MKSTPADRNKLKTVLPGSKTKYILKKRTKLLEKRLKNCKKTMQETPEKDQTCKSWASKKEKACKSKVYEIYSTK
jgi:hypothetical protein